MNVEPIHLNTADDDVDMSDLIVVPAKKDVLVVDLPAPKKKKNVKKGKVPKEKMVKEPKIPVQDGPATFKWSRTMYHLTYKTHIDHEALLAMIRKNIGVRKLLHWSVVHENADPNSPYEHTHCVIHLDSAGNWLGPRKFDFEGIHPSAEPCSLAHFLNAWSYQDKAPIGEITRSDPMEAESDFHSNFIETCQEFKGSYVQLLQTKGAMGRYICAHRHVAQLILAARVPAKSIPLLNARKWQQKTIDLLDGPPHPREIIFIVDPQGGNGKSYLTRYLVESKGAIYFKGKLADIAYAYDGERIVLFDMKRADLEFDYVSLEMFKDGLIFSSKYIPTLKRFVVPHVVVLTNTMPDLTKLTADRYRICKIKQRKEKKAPIQPKEEVWGDSDPESESDVEE